MTAIVTDINEYRAQKVGNPNPFEDWTDIRLKTRYDLLKFIREDGNDFLTDADNSLVQLSFPGGFDPGNKPKDNIFLVEAELGRRGVELT